MGLQIIDNELRSKLSEGRNYGIGFAFCKQEADSDEVYTTIQPISPCRDFLNDVVWTEHTGHNFHAYGLSTVKRGIFTPDAYVVMGILPYYEGNPCYNHDALEKALMAPQGGLIPFLTYFERLLGISPTIFAQIASNRMLARLNAKWVEGTFLISLWSLLVRIGLKYKEGDPMVFLKTVEDDDAIMARSAAEKIERMVKTGIPKQDLVKLKNPHDMGIVTFNW